MGIRSFQNKVPSQGERVFVDPASTVIGEVTLGNDSSVWPGAVVRGDMHHIVIGARTSVQDNAVLHITHDSAFNPGGFPLTLGDDVTVGHQAMLHGCTIGENSLIGMGATVLNGAVIGKNCLIGAGALVTEGKEIPDGSLVVGAPGKVIRQLDEAAIEGLRRSALHYQQNMRRFRAGLVVQTGQ